ncbi:hypothetical protein [Oceanobacillus iheyensis HTE831]|uniref:Uncharacterized protein n=1 Tax=Oceanobacillus iheyensis (strain DSM 14371 / CIP 107618 / JCM 11309 / KCTC 3954 / HTE831) TaxID=221109 RepID=Q8EKZ2_OCEIH|nr:hypothetical protein [Oceanobacillus iheyensis HTE831]
MLNLENQVQAGIIQKTNEKTILSILY